MQITDEHLNKIQELYRTEFGEVIGKDVALDQATALVQLVKIALQQKAETLTKEKIRIETTGEINN